MNFIRRIMIGRNGPDHLSIAFIALGLVLMLVSSFVTAAPARLTLQILDYVCLIVFFYRTLSRNVYKRQAENMAFLTAVGKVKGWIRLRWRMISESRTYRFLKCPKCGQRLRVPRGKGKIRVNCSRCTQNFECKV